MHDRPVSKCVDWVNLGQFENQIKPRRQATTAGEHNTLPRNRQQDEKTIPALHGRTETIDRQIVHVPVSSNSNRRRIDSDDGLSGSRRDTCQRRELLAPDCSRGKHSLDLCNVLVEVQNFHNKYRPKIEPIHPLEANSKLIPPENNHNLDTSNPPSMVRASVKSKLLEFIQNKPDWPAPLVAPDDQNPVLQITPYAHSKGSKEVSHWPQPSFTHHVVTYAREVWAQRVYSSENCTLQILSILSTSWPYQSTL